MTESIKQWIDKQSEVEAIYEPKYGGKDHSGYDTMMKYEVNYERMDAFSNGLTKGIEIAEGFAEWVDGYHYYIFSPNNWKSVVESEPNLTTSQLLEKYLKTLEP